MTYSDIIAVRNEAGFEVGKIRPDKDGNIVFDPSLISFTTSELSNIIGKMQELIDATARAA